MISDWHKFKPELNLYDMLQGQRSLRKSHKCFVAETCLEVSKKLLSVIGNLLSVVS